jgi:hypothetical protein
MQAEKQSGGVGFLDKVEDWRTRAKQIRVIAEAILDGASRHALLQIADDWEWMAQSAEEEKIAAEGGVTLVPASSEELGD